MVGTDRRSVRLHLRGAPGGRALPLKSALDVEYSEFDLSCAQMKRYLITGASRGIGRAIAEKLAGKDVELLLHGRDTVALAQTRKVSSRNVRR